MKKLFKQAKKNLKAEKNKNKQETHDKEKKTRMEEEDGDSVDFDQIQQDTFMQVKPKAAKQVKRYTKGIFFDKISGKLVIKNEKSTSMIGFKRNKETFDDVDFSFQKNKSHTPDEQMGARVLKRIKMGRGDKSGTIHQISKKLKITATQTPHAFVQFNPIVS